MSIRRSSRSAINTRKNCEMRRYKTYEFRQTGIQPKDFAEKIPGVIGMSALPKVRGAILHELSLAIVEGAERKDWDPLLAEKTKVLPESIRQQQTVLIRRAMMGWELIRGPWWKEHFDVISAEDEWLWQITPNIVQPLRLDKILRRKDDGFLGIFDYKTMSQIDINWIQRMENSDQTHLYVQALKERSGEFVLGICYDAIIIGKQKKGFQDSPLITGYEKGGKISPKWSYGAEMVDISGYDDEKWLEWAHVKADVLKDLYATSGFLNPPAHLLLHTKLATGRAEEEWYARVDNIETIRVEYGEESDEYHAALGVVEKNPDMCLKYGYEHACPFVDQCWMGLPASKELFEPRIDHHGEDE